MHTTPLCQVFPSTEDHMKLYFSLDTQCISQTEQTKGATLTFRVKSPLGAELSSRWEVFVSCHDRMCKSKLTCGFSLLRPSPRLRLGKRRRAGLCFQPVPWLLCSKTPFLKKDENSQMACLDRWTPSSAWDLRGELEDDSITRNRLLR